MENNTIDGKAFFRLADDKKCRGYPLAGNHNINIQWHNAVDHNPQNMYTSILYKCVLLLSEYNKDIIYKSVLQKTMAVDRFLIVRYS